MYENVMGIVMGHTILEMDEPEHRKYRTLLQQAFTKKSLEAWEHTLVRPVIDRLIDKFIDRGEAELVSELTWPFPVDVIGGLYGLLTHPDQLDAVRADPEVMIPKAMEEGLRWEPPLLLITRQATKDTEVC